MAYGQPFLKLHQAQAFFINKVDSELNQNNLSSFLPPFSTLATAENTKQNSTKPNQW